MVVICSPTRYQLDHRDAHPFWRTKVINTVQSPAYSRSEFSAISSNSIVIMADVNVESKVEQPWPYMSTMFRFLSEKGLRFIKRHLTAMQQPTPDDQPGIRSFGRQFNNSNVPWLVSTESIYTVHDGRGMANHQTAVIRNKHSPVSYRCMRAPVQCSWAFIHPNEGSHWRHQLWKSAFAEVE